MRFTAKFFLIAAIAASPVMWTASAEAACVTKAATASGLTANQAKWFAMETIVQQVSWAIWPAWVASGQTPGYKFSNKKYSCSSVALGTECTASAKICPAG